MTTGDERAFDLSRTLSVRRAWMPCALAAGRRLLAPLGRRLACSRRPRLRLAIDSCRPGPLREPSSAGSAPDWTWFRPSWTYLTPTYLEMNFGPQVFDYRPNTVISHTSHGARAAGHRQPSEHRPADLEPYGVSPGSHARALPNPALVLTTAVGSGSLRHGAAPAAVLGSTTAIHHFSQFRPFAQPSPPRDGEMSSPDRPARTSYSAGAGLVFCRRVSGADPVTTTATDHWQPQAGSKPSALVDALFDQARRQRGLAGLDLRVLPASVAQQARPAADAAPGMAAYPAAEPPANAGSSTRLSRNAISQVADQVATLLRQRERLERERKGGFPWR